MKMKYDFITKPDRRGMDAMAVDLPPHEAVPGMIPEAPVNGRSLIPMWVADMNFITAPPVTEAIVARAKHPAYGYYVIRDEWYSSIIRWQESVHGVTALPREAIGYENGVLGGVSSALRVLTSPGDPVLLHSPTYIGFTGCVTKIGRRIVLSPLKRDGNGIWRMDYEDMEKKIRDNHIHTAIFCSPHNPTGRVWTREELGHAAEIFRRNDISVICDEIWSDILLNGSEHIPFYTVNDDMKMRTVTLNAPSKTFNLAGLIGSYHIIFHEGLRDRVRREGESTGYNSMNVLSQHALIGAYSAEGEEWMRELRTVLSENVNFACDDLERNFPDASVTKPEGTYMLFIDWSGYLASHGMTLDELLKAGWDAGVAWQDGRPFHGSASVRMNLALPTAYVKEAFARLGAVLK